MKRIILLTLALFCCVVALTALNVRNGKVDGRMISSALVVTGSPTPTPSANANTVTKTSANANAAANVVVKIGNTNVNADTSTRKRFEKFSNTNSSKTAKVKENANGNCNCDNLTAENKKLKQQLSQSKLVAKAHTKATSVKSNPTPKATKPTGAKTTKPANKPVAKTKAKEVSKPTTKPATNSTTKPASNSAKKNPPTKVTPNLDDKTLAKELTAKKAEEQKTKGPQPKADPTPSTEPLHVILTSPKTTYTEGEAVVLNTTVTGGTPPYRITNDGGKKIAQGDTTVSPNPKAGLHTYHRDVVDAKGQKVSTDLPITVNSSATTAQTDDGKKDDPPPPLTLGQWFQAKWEEFKSIPSVFNQRPLDAGRMLTFNPWTYIGILGLVLLILILRWMVRAARRGRAPAPRVTPAH